jgi:LCP family protein required for cell wall assembly
MLRVRIRLILLYVIVLVAILSAVSFAKLHTFAQLFHVGIEDVFATLPPSVVDDDSVTLLLLGIGGGDHDGPNLTDSITYLRYIPKSHTVNTLGIPRDLWDPDIKDKINSIYTYALQQDKLSAYAYVKEKYTDLLHTQIDYILVVNFNDFEQLIDLLGGVQIHIDRGFVDTQYPKDGFENAECEPYDPDYGCRYETLIFRAGDQKLNGNVALKFVRSRHAQGDEGTDFSRSKRQQLMIGAIRSKLVEIMKKRDFDSLARVLVFINEKIKRDITNKEFLALGRTLLLDSGNVKTVAHTLDEELFEIPPLEDYEGRYVLIPKDNDFEVLRATVDKKLNSP